MLQFWVAMESVQLITSLTAAVACIWGSAIGCHGVCSCCYSNDDSHTVCYLICLSYTLACCITRVAFLVLSTEMTCKIGQMSARPSVRPSVRASVRPCGPLVNIFPTLMLRDGWARLMKLGIFRWIDHRGTKLPGSGILNFGPFAVRER